MIIKHKRMVKFELIRDGQVVKTTVVNKTVGFNEHNGNWTIPVFLFEGRHTVEILHEGQTFTVKVCHLDNHRLTEWLKCVPCDVYMDAATFRCCPRCGSTKLIACNSHGHVLETNKKEE